MQCSNELYCCTCFFVSCSSGCQEGPAPDAQWLHGVLLLHAFCALELHHLCTSMVCCDCACTIHVPQRYTTYVCHCVYHLCTPEVPSPLCLPLRPGCSMSWDTGSRQWKIYLYLSDCLRPSMISFLEFVPGFAVSCMFMKCAFFSSFLFLSYYYLFF